MAVSDEAVREAFLHGRPCKSRNLQYKVNAGGLHLLLDTGRLAAAHWGDKQVFLGVVPLWSRGDKLRLLLRQTGRGHWESCADYGVTVDTEALALYCLFHANQQERAEEGI